MLSDREILEKRLDLFTSDTWSLFVEELTSMANSLDQIQNIDDEKTLFLRRGQVDILNMITNVERTTKLALDQLD